MKVSIVIPVFNKEDYLEKCLSSVVNQTFRDIQIIVINDGSTDGSLDICEKYAAEDKRIELINQENKGVSASRNYGIDLAKGEWIYFVDADDYLDLETIEILIQESLIDSNIDVIEFGIKKIKNKVTIGERVPSKKNLYSDNVRLIIENELKPFSAWFHLIKLNLLEEHNIRFEEDMRHNEDLLFMYKVLIQSKKTLVLDRALYNQVFSDSSVTRSGVSKIQLINNIQFADKLITYCKDHGLAKSLKQDLNKILKYFFVSLVFYPNFINEYRSFEDIYNEMYDSHKDILTDVYLKTARISFLLVLLPLYVKFRMFKKNHIL